MTKSILITGASSGIGKAVSTEMAKRGYSLALTARRLDLLEKIKEGIDEACGELADKKKRMEIIFSLRSVLLSIDNLLRAMEEEE